MTTTTSGEERQSLLGYSVKKICIGVIASSDSDDYATGLAKRVRQLGPDRFDVQVVLVDVVGAKDCDESSDVATSWPKMQVLVVCCSRPNFPSSEINSYVEKNQPILVLTDFDISRNISDRRVFYDVLEAGGIRDPLPVKVYVSRDGYPDDENNDNTDVPIELLDRRDQVVINGVVLAKPVLERVVDPSDTEVRIYYPRSIGGGCKIITFDDSLLSSNSNFRSEFDPEIKHIRKDDNRSFIYEEVAENSSKKIRPVAQKTRSLIAVTESITGIGQKEIPSFDDDDEVSYESNLSRMDRKIFIVTTASLPWMTGTAVNPLLRAAYLKKGRGKGSVTLVIPWLESEDERKKVYGKNEFNTKEEQELFVRTWLKDQASMPEEADEDHGIKIIWYDSRYHKNLGSIFPKGDICSLIPDEDADFCILEEPEHLNWFRPRSSEIWTEKFTHVVGIIHTNYKAYAAESLGGVGHVIAAPVVSGLSTLMVRAYCDKVIKLSATLQTYAPEKEVVCNVHGVRSDFLAEGKRRAEEALKKPQGETVEISETPFESIEVSEKPVAYFIGKLLWEKGLDRLLRLQYFYREVTGDFFPIDIIGDGPDRSNIEKAYLATSSSGNLVKNLLARDSGDLPTSKENAELLSEEITNEINELNIEIPESDDASFQVTTSSIPARFHGRQDHAEFCSDYKVIVNPSITEVLCTTTAEALAMGKFAVIPKHPSNEFFYQFPNCLAYETKVEFVKYLVFALVNEPEPLTDELSYVFTWEAASERLIQSSAITMKMARQKTRTVQKDQRIARYYNNMGKGISGDVFQMGKNFKGDVQRMVFGGRPVKKDKA